MADEARTPRLPAEATIEALSDAIIAQTALLGEFNRRLGNFATTTDLNDRMEVAERNLKRARWRTRLLLSLVGVIVSLWSLGVATGSASKVNQESKARAGALCSSQNNTLQRLRAVIDLSTEPLPVNPAAPPSVQTMIAAQNQAKLAFRQQLEREGGPLASLDCSKIVSGANLANHSHTLHT